MSQRTLLMGGVVHSRVDPFATALLLDGPNIAWVGDDAGAHVHRDVVDAVVDLNGAFVAPGFVDSHIHATSTGLRLTGLDLTAVRSGPELLDSIARHATATRGAPIYGHGWDDTHWAPGELPSRRDIDRAAFGSEVYLSRIDVHSALVSTALVARDRTIEGLSGYSSDGPVSQEAHSALRVSAFASMPSGIRKAAQRAALEHARANGIVAVHEMSGPSIGGEADARDLVAVAQNPSLPRMTLMWGERASAEAFARLRDLGAYGLAGDLFVDGSLGSRTAALHEPYSDDPHNYGTTYLSEEDIVDHVRQCSLAGIPAGFHVIGDAACAQVAEAMRVVAREVGAGAVRALGHRLEHAEMLSASDISDLASLGVTFSMQPLFDALWGHGGGMYDQRLGPDRAAAMNPFADIVTAGGHLVINSDSPVTPMRPWSFIRAATEHSNPSQRISARAAFTAATRGGWRAIRNHEAGDIAPGAPAHLAVWAVEDLEVRVPDHRIREWSTDPRAATPGLPRLDGPDPQCVTTIIDGECCYGEEFWREHRVA